MSDEPNQDATASTTTVLRDFPSKPGRADYRALVEALAKLGYRKTREYSLYALPLALSRYDTDFDRYGLDEPTDEDFGYLPEPYRSFKDRGEFRLLLHASTEKPLIVSSRLILLPDDPEAVDALWGCVVDLACRAEQDRAGQWAAWVEQGREAYYDNMPNTLLTSDPRSAQEILASVRYRIKKGHV